jgi:hypothetical protein
VDALRALCVGWWAADRGETDAGAVDEAVSAAGW